MDAILIITNLPDRDSAENLARQLVETRVAACVNVMPPCFSVYHWQKAVETAEEIPVFIKTMKERYADVETLIRQYHPYELPEIVAVPIANGLPAYLQWVATETSTIK
jgi:periplasmic divalent cation tolerance protein